MPDPQPNKPVARRKFLLGAGATLGATLGVGLTRAAAATTPVPAGSGMRRRSGVDSRPNILWIITDDATRRTLKTMPHTMNLLVDKGVNFVNGYTAIPWCGPARLSMLTSMYVHNHGVCTNMTNPPIIAKGLDKDTVATRLAAAGYVNGFFGKYMNGHGKDPRYIAPGWHRWVTLPGDDATFNIDGKLVTIDPNKELVDYYSTHRLQEFMHTNVDKPWFAVFSATAPHDPYTPSAKHEHDFDHVAWDPPAFNETNLGDKSKFLQSIPMVDRTKMEQIWEGKLEELRDVDDQIRDLFGTLADTGQLDNTMIMMISDNGYLLGEHRLFRKEQPYEESAGVPFTVRGPGFSPSAPTALVSQVDLMPTTLAFAGLNPDAGRALDGRSMLANLRSGDWSNWRQRLLCENTKLGWAMLREDNYAYIDYYSRGATELYDLRNDPYQMNAIPASSSRVAARRSSALSRVNALRSASGVQLRSLEM